MDELTPTMSAVFSMHLLTLPPGPFAPSCAPCVQFGSRQSQCKPAWVCWSQCCAVFTIQGSDISCVDFPYLRAFACEIPTLNLVFLAQMTLQAPCSCCWMLHCCGHHTSLLHGLRCKQTASLLSFYFRNNKPNRPRMSMDW